MNQGRMSLTVEGWRGINHSFALVNQFQLLEMVKLPGLNIGHTDAPFHFAHWNASTNGAGFHAADEATLAALAPPRGDTACEWTFRIFSPIDLRSPEKGGRLAVFAVTELGLDPGALVAGSDIRRFEAEGGWVVTPSHWSRARMVEFGFTNTHVHVIPHAASADYFFPLPAQTVQAQRTALGFAPDDVLLLNIGAAIWNKGIDTLLKGFALARQTRKDLRLVFKDQRNTYGISGETFIHTTLAQAGLLNGDVLGAITLIPSNLTMDQMNSMYNLADCYVSPYRAEGFNLPVCEAMACGTPVITTAGGATDDFASGADCQKIDSVLHRNTVIQGREIAAYCEPDLDHLVTLLLNTGKKNLTELQGNQALTGTGGWNDPVQRLLSLMQ
jgi:glycosyltransferase involved in cell wall biosynthesis